jgi:hypothetical protein
MTARVRSGVLLAFLLLAGNAGASILTKTVQFENPTLASDRGGVVPVVAGCRTIGYPGEPVVPVYPAVFVIPPGEIVSRVTIEPERTVALAGSYDVAPMPAQAPLGFQTSASGVSLASRAPLGAQAPAAVPRDEKVYGSSEPYPRERGELATEQVLSGIRFAFVNVYPCTFIPSSKTLLFSPSVRVTIETRPASGKPVRAPVFQTRRAASLMAGRVENPEDVSRYIASAVGRADTEPTPDLVHYLIVTSPAFAPALEPLVELKNRCGLRARVVDTGWIISNFAGVDTQEKIRNFIRYAYENWQTRYVLLAGDDEIIPHRGLYVKVGTQIEIDIPSDLYYSCLDGNWNGDGDQYFGEPGEEDLLPEVVIGRLPVDSAEEIANVIAKISSYSLSPVASQCTTALMAGELLWSEGGVNTWGGDYKDEIYHGSSNYGFTTAGIPSGFTTATLYDRDGVSWTKADILALLNGGVHFVNHLGHSSPFSIMRLAAGDIASLSNDGTGASFFICYSQGCYAASFDNRDDAGVVHPEDCIGEELVTGPHGAVAFIGNTRLGWDAPGTTCGVSQFFDRQFFDAVFGEGIEKLGEALDDSKLDNIPYLSYDAVRWVYYDLCLLGDPALSLWTATPRELVATHDSVLYEGQSGFEIHVSDESGPVPGALASLNSTSSSLYCAALTDEAGTAVLEPCASSGSSLLFSVVSANHYPSTDTVRVGSSPSYLATLVLTSTNDDLGSGADGDGRPEAGETVELAVVVRNVGVEALSQVEVSLASRDSYVTVADGSSAIGTLASGASVDIDTAFSVVLSPLAPNNHRAAIEFVITSAEGSWKAPQSIEIAASDAVLESWALADTASGNGNGCIEAWEFQNLSCVYRNRGSSEVIAPTLTLSFPENSWGKAIKNVVAAPVIPAGGTASFPPDLLWFVNERTPPFSKIAMILTLQAQGVPARAETVTVRTCGYGLVDSASVEEPFGHAAVVGMDQWHVSAERFHSPPSSWKCGGASGGAYANMTESVLTLPPLCLFDASSMTFWHRMNAEAGTIYPYWALDAGVVEISVDHGRTWTIINPVSPYPSRASPYNTIFLPAYQRCYSGIFDWRKETFDLSAYHGPVLIQFHFASDEQYGYEGWYLDDIYVTTNVPTGVDPGDLPSLERITRLEPAYPNPFNPMTSIPFEIASKGRVSIGIFDVAGRRIRTLLAGTVDAGRHAAHWDGTDNLGRPVASGVYFVRLESGAYSATSRLVLIR